MGESNFFIEKTKVDKVDGNLSPQMRAIIVAAVSVLYGVVALFIASSFLEMRGIPLFGIAAIYTYGILGGLAILMLIRIFAGSEESKKMLLDILDQDNNPYAITGKDGKYLYSNKAWRILFGNIDTLSYKNVSSAFLRSHQLLQQLQRPKSLDDSNEPFIFTDQNTNKNKWFKLTVCVLSEWKDCTQWHILDITNDYKRDQNTIKNSEEIDALTTLFRVNISGKISFKNKALFEGTNKNKNDRTNDEPQFEHVFMDAPLGICIVQSDFILSSCNVAFMSLTGLNNKEYASLLEVIVPEQHETLQQWVAMMLQDNDENIDLLTTSLEIDVLKLNEDKGSVPTRIYAHKLDDNELVLYFIDLTQQKNLEQQFTQSQKMQGIGQLAGGIAHDFNNLLTAMIGFCDLLLLRHKPGDPSFSDIMQVKQNANRASNLVRQLLAFSRQQTLQPKVLDVTDVLSDLLHLMQRLIGSNINLNIQHGQNLCPVKTDEGQLEQVLINLVVNARDAIKDSRKDSEESSGDLSIVTRNYKNTTLEKLNDEEYLPVGEWVIIDVKDSGTGIDPEVLSRIFEPFFSTKNVGEGTGLGLSTVHGIIHQTGGFLAVDSIVGEGTTFTIYLPSYQSGGSEEAEEAKIMSKVESLQDTKTEDLTGSAAILLVEDEDAVRIFSSRALSNKGYKIIDAPNGEAAMEVLEKEKISLELLITDVVMPEMDGPTLAKHVRRLYPDIKIIFMSGYSEDRFKEDFGKSTYFLQKPFTLKQLAKSVKDILEGE